VDEKDQPGGSIGKTNGHRCRLLHRAFPILLRDGRGAMRLQRRQLTQPHSGGLWTNATHGGARPGESALTGVTPRPKKELGIGAQLTEGRGFRYGADVGLGLPESNYVHLFQGYFAGDAPSDPAEYDWAVITIVHRLPIDALESKRMKGIW